MTRIARSLYADEAHNTYKIFSRWNVLDCLKSEPKNSLQGKNNLGARNTQSIFKYSCHFAEVALQVIWLALQRLWLRNTRAGTHMRHASMGRKQYLIQ